MTDRTLRDIPQSVRDEAVAWLVRIESDQVTGDDYAALTAWLEQSDAHVQAFNAAEAFSRRLEAAAGQISTALGDRSGRGVADDVCSINSASPVRSHRPVPIWRSPALRAAALAALTVLGGVAVTRAYIGSVTAYRTAPGETRALALRDGTRLELDADTHVSVRFGWTARRVDLVEGEVSFDVAKDPRRPFLVDIGDETVRVVGTQFNIRRFGGETAVTVRRGVVEVYDGAPVGAPVARLTRGWALVHRDGAAGSQVSTVDPDVAFAWTKGQLICDDQPLPEIVGYLNRRFPVPIHLSEEAAKRRFSGVLALRSQQEAARDLAQYLSLSEEQTDRGIVLR